MISIKHKVAQNIRWLHSLKTVAISQFGRYIIVPTLMGAHKNTQYYPIGTLKFRVCLLPCEMHEIKGMQNKRVSQYCVIIDKG